MKVTVQGVGDVTLTQREFLAQGGQGSVYALGDTAYKIYTDTSAMMPEGKIQELSPLPVDVFARPERIILDSKGRKIGYTSRFIKNAHVLCQLFPRSFRDREGLTHDKTFKLVKKMREGFDTAHKAGILLIDPNEMNFLVDPKFDKMTFIDTDSYQTKSYPATAIMESIRDRHMKSTHAFNEGTDWFSFAVTSFQMQVGIHPYKGKHPTLKGFEDRMLANVSVFHKDVSIPATAYPLDVIPANWRSWYESVFEKGDRTQPPRDGVWVSVVATMPQMAVVTSGKVNLTEVYQFEGVIQGLWVTGSSMVVSTTSGLWVDKRKVSDWTDTVAVGFVPATGSAIALRGHDTDIEVFDCQTRQPITSMGLAVDRTVQTEGRLYFKTGDKVLEGCLTQIGSKALLTTRQAASVLPNASYLFEGGATQNMLGSAFVSLFPQSGMSYQIRIPELDAYRVMEAKYEGGIKGGVLVVKARSKNGQYDRLMFRFDTTFSTYDVRKTEDVDSASSINFVVTDAGVCILLNEDDKLELSSTHMGSTQTKVVEDKALAGSRIYRQGTQVLLAKGDRLYAMKLA